MRRLDQLIAEATGGTPRATHKGIHAGEVVVDGRVLRDPSIRFSVFCSIELQAELIHHRVARYVMLHKPVGFVSATRDAEHPTVVDLINKGVTDDLHLAGRLDRNTTGLVLLTNDARWSQGVTRPGSGVPKTYLVGLEDEVDAAVLDELCCGVRLPGDGVMTLPADADLLGPKAVRLTLREGRHHQIKRMFALFENRVISLHRESVGGLTLDGLNVGEYRELSSAEIAEFARARE